VANKRLHLRIVALAALGALAVKATAFGVEKLKSKPAVSAAVAVTQVPHMSKGFVEPPTEMAIARRTTPVPTAVASSAAVANPRVAPGKVQWHANFAAACEAAQKSGKAVLLFQMMGKLDEQFC
jgi:hypothetical protein